MGKTVKASKASFILKRKKQVARDDLPVTPLKFHIKTLHITNKSSSRDIKLSDCFKTKTKIVIFVIL